MVLVLLRLPDGGAFSYSSGTVRTAPSMEREKIHESSDYQQSSFADVSEPETTAQWHTSLLTQDSIFPASGEHAAEFSETLVRLEGCQVINPPVVRFWHEKKRQKKEWKCTFVAPPDLWSQERADWIQAVTENTQDIAALNKLKLDNGDMCTVIGIQTGQRDEPMAQGETQRRLTFVKVTQVIPGIRGTSQKANVLPPKARHG
jgi:hypothetical protein